MQEQMVKYMDRLVPKKGFRAFVYGANDARKLTNSFEEFEIHTKSGDWFACQEDMNEFQEQSIKKKRTKPGE